MSIPSTLSPTGRILTHEPQSQNILMPWQRTGAPTLRTLALLLGITLSPEPVLAPAFPAEFEAKLPQAYYDDDEDEDEDEEDDDEDEDDEDEDDEDEDDEDEDDLDDEDEEDDDEEDDDEEDDYETPDDDDDDDYEEED